MKILITGGTGIIGGAIAKAAADKGCDDSHGLGIPNSLSICERYYGTLMFSQCEGIVTVTAMMQYPIMT